MFYTGYLAAPFDWLSFDGFFIGLIAFFTISLFASAFLSGDSPFRAISIFSTAVTVCCVAIILAVNNQGTTNKISESESVKSEEFSEKVIDVGELDSLDNDSYNKIKNNKPKEFNKDAFFRLTGKKNDNIVNVLVEFDKNDKMFVKISPSTDNKKNTEIFEYEPE